MKSTPECAIDKKIQKFPSQWGPTRMFSRASLWLSTGLGHTRYSSLTRGFIHLQSQGPLKGRWAPHL